MKSLQKKCTCLASWMSPVEWLRLDWSHVQVSPAPLSFVDMLILTHHRNCNTDIARHHLHSVTQVQKLLNRRTFKRNSITIIFHLLSFFCKFFQLFTFPLKTSMNVNVSYVLLQWHLVSLIIVDVASVIYHFVAYLGVTVHQMNFAYGFGLSWGLLWFGGPFYTRGVH